MKLTFNQISKVFLFLLFLFVLQSIASYLFIQQRTDAQMKQALANFNARVKNDISYTNGQWNIAKYADDPQTPHPRGSSGFADPLYIMTTNGFVIERSNPIAGFFDTADFQQLTQYSEPQTITTVTGETWRIAATPVQQNGSTNGVIVVSYYNPQPQLLSEIDAKLTTTLQNLRSSVTPTETSIDTSHVDIRSVNYDLGFVIVDQYNKVLSRDGRVPTFIDRSYVSQALQLPQTMSVTDHTNNQQYFVETSRITDSSGKAIAVIISARSITTSETILHEYLAFGAAFAIVVSVPLLFIVLYALRQEIVVLMQAQLLRERPEPKQIIFNRKASAVVIDDEPVQIPYASNQYYLCDIVFANPKRRFEQDEILDRFGEESNRENWRKVYDAMLAINKKCALKLISYKDKTYRVNPAFSHIAKIEK